MTKTKENEGAEIADIKELVSDSNATATPEGFEKLAAADDEETPAPAPDPEKPSETPQPAPPAPETPASAPEATPQPQPAQTVTASQIVAGTVPDGGALPPLPGKRGRGRPPGSGNKPKEGEPGASNIVIPAATAAATEPATPQVNHRQLAEITFDLTTNSMASFLGPEWRHNSKEEREGMLVPLEMYLRTKKMDDIPPGAILCFAIATYAAPRLRAPATSSKLKLWGAWIRDKWANRKKRKDAPNVISIEAAATARA